MCTRPAAGPLFPVTAAREDDSPRLRVPLEPVDQVTITTLVDNNVDLFAPSVGPARRPSIGDSVPGPAPLFEGSWTYAGLIAEHGFSALVTVTVGDARHDVLFDTGLSPDAMVTNMRRLGIDPGGVEAIVLSHGHFDHRRRPGRLRPRGRPRRAARSSSTRNSGRRRLVIPGRDPVELPTTSRRALEGAGFPIIEERQPSFLLAGRVLITGEVDRTSGFEPGSRPSRRCATAAGSRTRWSSTTRRSS